MNITSEQIAKLKKGYESNKEDLKRVESCIARHGCTDDGLSSVGESFEQGLNNAMEFVFATLGVSV